MAIEVPDLSVYTICQLADGTELKMPYNMFSYDPQRVVIFIFPEERSFEEVENLFQNQTKIKKIIIKDQDSNNIYATLAGYSVLLKYKKKYQEAYREGYDDGEYFRYTTDLYLVTLCKPSINDMLPKLQSDLEYLAIMSDIDIDESI